MAPETSSSTSRLDNKVALVTGSSRGMGRQHALELAGRGASVVVNYLSSPEAAANVVQEIEKMGHRAVAIKANVSKPAEIEQLFEKLSIILPFGAIEDVTPEDFDRIIGVNTRGQFFVAQQAYKHLQVGGRLILLSSISAQAKGVRNHALYSGSKSAVEAFARCFATNFGAKRITVNAIAPGGVKTDMYTEAAHKYLPGSDDWTDEKVDQVIASWTPLGRPAYPEDVSRVVALLASEDGGWINGQTISISGGSAQ